MPPAVVGAGDKWAGKIKAGWLQWVEENEEKNPAEWGVFDLTPYIRGGVLDGLDIAGLELEKLGLGVKFDLRNPLTEAWIKSYSAQAIKGLDDANKKAIRDIILKGQVEGLTSTKQAQLIRQHIGLDPRRSTALLNYAEQLRKAGATGGALDKALAKYRQKLINDRAMTISLSEGHLAANEGYRQGNLEAVKRGILNPDEWARYWMTTRDNRTCTICEGLSGAEAILPDGHFEGDGRGPPRHPRCRCTEGLRKRK
jgi:hypothetical protein